jgi:hypothetical protein
MVDARETLPNERELLRFLLERGSFPCARELADQVERTHVVGGLPTFLDLEVRRPAPRSACEDGRIPQVAFVHSLDGEVTGTLLVWVADGYLAGPEYAWHTDETPSEMPPADRVQVT